MSTKQTQLAYLHWLKQTSPATYQRAVKRALSAQGLGALGDDLIESVGIGDASLSAADIGDASTAIANASATVDDSSWSNLFSNIVNAVSSIAPTVVSTQAQLATINLNAQRAAAGLPPVGSSALTTGVGLSSISPTMIMIIVALGGGLLLLSKKGK
jgi:hypothetical protein